MLGGYTHRSPVGCVLFTASNTRSPVPGDRITNLFKQGTAHLRLNLVTDLQEMAFRIRATGLYTICNLYSLLNNVTLYYRWHTDSNRFWDHLAIFWVRESNHGSDDVMDSFSLLSPSK